MEAGLITREGKVRYMLIPFEGAILLLDAVSNRHAVYACTINGTRIYYEVSENCDAYFHERATRIESTEGG